MTRRRRKPLPALLAACLALILWPALSLAWSTPAGAGTERPAFADELDLILGDPRLSGAQAGVLVADAETGETLYARGAENRLMPASTTKLLTTAAALDVLGPDYTYATEVHATGDLTGRVLDGDLYLRGTGDPTLLPADYRSLARQVADAGVTDVTGDLVADDTRFDDERFHWGWNVDDEQYYYGAPVSALTVAPDTDYDAGTVIVRVTPGDRPGDRPAVTLVPDTGHLTVRNTATTVAGDSAVPAIERAHGSDTLAVSGSIGVDRAPVRVWRAVWDPTAHAAAVFRAALAAQGVTVHGGTRPGEATPPAARTLATHRSMTVAELLGPLLKLSNNGHSEVLAKTMGREARGSGSWEAGTEVIREALTRLGLREGTYVLADGSGLSRRTYVPAEGFAALLLAARDRPWFDTWYERLPIACAPDRLTGGTLRSRMCGTPAAGNAHAKTGSLTGATGLSGYVTGADGRQLVFSIVLNYYVGSAPKDLEDRIVIALASHGAEDSDAAHPSPAPLSGVRPQPPAGEHDSAWAKPEDPTLISR